MKLVTNSSPIIGVWSAIRLENPGKAPLVRALLGSAVGPVHRRGSSLFIKSSIVLELISVELEPKIPRETFNLLSAPSK
ncbi:hypothetical protein D3C76_1612920 [compost metagenome]